MDVKSAIRTVAIDGAIAGLFVFGSEKVQLFAACLLSIYVVIGWLAVIATPEVFKRLKNVTLTWITTIGITASVIYAGYPFLAAGYFAMCTLIFGCYRKNAAKAGP